ncbi:MAG: hypothetical protein JW808_10830, partial [Victivallales bacterium]|nr:hypothetical protein [Victivallales bacterium]
MKPAEIEKNLNDINPEIRREAVCEFRKSVLDGGLAPKKESDIHNLHCHTFFSYNAYGYSPSYIACLARREGWFAAGIVDFDVLDGCDEFLSACSVLGVRGVCGMETRAFLPEFSSREINSPGEPGITYHMGVGFTGSELPGSAGPKATEFLGSMRQGAARRTREMVAKVNSFLDPVTIDFDKDVVPLTPAGNATERHLCSSYEIRAAEIFPEVSRLAKFWAGKLDIPPGKAIETVGDSVKLQGLIRSKTMKSGGIGYVKPDADTFPNVKDVNNFILAAGAIPVITWLNGLSEGEQSMDELLDLHVSLGAAFLNIIPDRNWNIKDPSEKASKMKELQKMIAACEKRAMPVI